MTPVLTPQQLRRAEKLAQLLTAAQDEATYEVKVWVLVEDPETGEIKRFRRPRMTVYTKTFFYKVSLRKGEFKVSRFVDFVPKAATPTMFYSWSKAAASLKAKWVLHGTMDYADFLAWLKTVLGERAYLAFAEMVR